MRTMTTNLLFHRRTLGKAIECYDFPDNLLTLQARILQWLEPLRSGVLDEVKEVSLHGQFLGDIFGRVLGYRSIIDGGGKSWEIHAEQSISDGGGTSDAAIGLFTAVSGKSGKQKLAGKIIAPIELKGAKNDLDRPAPGRKESAVDQGWRYANYTPDCKWVIVSNYREIRLYNLSKTPAYYEQFYLSDLAEVEQFKQFYFLLCRDNFIPAVAGSVSAIDLLLSASNQAEEEITDRLYREYKHVRLELTQHFSNSDPNVEVEIAIEKAQKTLDRILFITFCEDRGLLPARTIEQAHDHRDPYHPERQIWDNYQSIFRSVDKGNDALKIPSYNGGLFKLDPILDKKLRVSDALCTQLKNLARFDFETEVSVNILGHIFEQSITDLEELRATAAGEKFDVSKGKRKTQGVYYTPAYITQYIVDVALGGYLRRQEAALRIEYSLTSPDGEATPTAPLSERLTKKRQQIEVKFWEAYRAIIVQTRVIDPACGSGAFLIAAFEYLSREYERVNTALAELKSGQRSVFDLNKTILNNNLYGVDLSPESVEITKLSLWLKTAERGKPLTDLNNNIKAGNSIVNDPSIDARAFNWETAFPDIFAAGGFDVVLGNPPYVRQELLTPIKPYLQQHYQSYDGVADLYTYFYERGIQLLKPDGVMSYIVTNKWFKAGYGENLRRFFVEHTIFEQIVDFGHAPIFQDADTFPCIVSVRKPLTPLSIVNCKLSTDLPILICPVPREKLVDINLAQYVQSEGYHVPASRFTSDAWSLEHPDVETLMQKIKAVGVPLKEFVGVKPYYGIKTGFNEAFLIDNATRDRIVQADPKSAEIIKPYLRGQDVKRWHSEWQNIWMIVTTSSIDIDDYLGVKQHLEQYRTQLEKRAGSQQWWQLQGRPGYLELLEQPKIIYQVIQFHPQYTLDILSAYENDKTYFLPSSDLCLLGYLNSPLFWWYSWRYFPHMKDDALNPAGYLMGDLPIALPDDKLRAEVEAIASRSIELTKSNQSSYRDIYDWLQLEHQIEKLGRKLEDFSSLSLEEFVQEIKKRKSKDDRALTPQSLKEIKAAYQEYAPQIQTRKAEILQLEHQLSDLVNRAYQLTPAEIELMWRTAPPRMPITRKYAP